MKLAPSFPRTRRLLACAAVLAFSAGGCVEDVGLIDRTGSDKIDKQLFEGVWLYMQTTVDVPFSTAISFVGEQPFIGGTRKVVFDVQEQWLVAYPVTETVQGSEADWKTHSVRKYWDPDRRDEFVEMYLGPPVARWPIESHFDVKRNYNTFNQAQSNEVVENTTDRAWYERDFVRVRWNRQGIRDFFFGLRGGHGADSYYVGEEKEGTPDELTLDPDNGYFDFVVRTVAWSTGQNRCSIYGLSPFDCARAEVKVRHAFRRLDHRRDYEPLRYHNEEHQDLFGYFATERPTYDLDWGPTYRGSVSYANRWNLWRETYDFQLPTDADGNPQTISCMLDRDCDRDAGQRCQKDESWFSEGYCAVPIARPYNARGLKPIIFHLNADWHPTYRRAAYESADGWDDAFKEAISWLLFYDEIGLARTRGCDTHSDCGTSDLLADVLVTVVDNGVPCNIDGNCGTGVCDGGYCAVSRTCNATSPCAAGQTCSGGVCMDGATPVVRRLTTQTLRGSTLVVGPGVQAVTHDNFPPSIRQTLPAGHAFVRFLNLAPDVGALGVDVDGVIIPGGAFDASRDLDPLDPATQTFMAAVPASGAATIRITSGGSEIASTLETISGNSHALVIYNGTDIIVASTAFTASERGIRLIHAANGEGPIDFGVEGIRRAESVGYRGATEYVSSAGSINRATATRAGTRGDITCYQADTIGHCVGWPRRFTPADRDRVRQIKDQLPAIFVLCENQYDSIAASQTFQSEAERIAHLGDARYTRGDGYNPCGDTTLVAHPEQLKKIGDARYSFSYWIDEPQRAGPLGYGPSQADPDTGEIIVGNSNMYGGAVHTYAQYAKDLVDLVSGRLGPGDIITGDWIRDYLSHQESQNDAHTDTFFGAMKAGDPIEQPLDPFALDRDESLGHAHHGHVDPAFDRARMLGLSAPQRQLQDWDFPELMDFMRDPSKLQGAIEVSLPQVDPNHLHQRLNKISGTWIEDLAINNEIKLAAEFVDPERKLSPSELYRQLSPTSWSSKRAIEQERQRLLTLSLNNVYMGEFIDDSLFGIAQEMRVLRDEHGWTDAQIRDEIGHRIAKGVIEHEIGHTVGLRHNFSGSTDVFNFHDEYYQIREKELILCQANGWCDDINGEACAIRSCGSDADCFAGTLCNQNTCSAPAANGSQQLVATGVCSSPIENTAPCTSDSHCGGGEAVCYQNRCYAPREQLVPRSWMTDLEKAGKRTEFQYTSIMDYGGRVNSDIRGLGKYDYAAIRFGYAQLVDTYADTSRIDRRIENAARITGSSLANYSFYKNTAFWPTRGVGFFHPFNYLGNYIGVEENLNRIPVPWDQVKYQNRMAINNVREYLDLEYVRVPYAYCSDEFRGNMGCYYFDQGIDMGEMGASARAQLEQYYIFDAFKRERLYYAQYGNPMAYYWRIMDRYLRVIGDVGMYYGFYDTLLFRYSWYQSWKDMPLGGRTLEQAARDAFDALTDIIAAPSPGSYVLDPRTGSYRNVSFDANVPGTAFNVPFGIGRFPYTQFGSDLGYHYFEHPLWFGSFWEKLGAIVTLTDSTAYFVDTSVGEQLNIGVGTSIGFNTVFYSELNNFLGGIVAGDLDFYAGRLTNGAYVPPSISRQRFQDVPVEPALNNFTLRLYSAIYGLAFMPAGFDPQFIDRMAVFLEGEASQYYTDPDLGLTEYRWSDPIGGKVYLAYGSNYGDFGQPKVDAAAELVLRGQDLSDDWMATSDPIRKAELQQEIGQVREMLDVLRQLHHIYGTSTLGF